jgi:hypothetical protein
VAWNETLSDGRRIRAVKKRFELKITIQGEEHYTTRDKTSGEFMAQKANDNKYEGVRKEK